MRDLENLLANAFPEELENTPPAPVDKGAIRDKTFQKLGLEIPGKKVTRRQHDITSFSASIFLLYRLKAVFSIRVFTSAFSRCCRVLL